jgi:ssDNA thymidine ADP-ribosyltransferase, DarT
VTDWGAKARCCIRYVRRNCRVPQPPNPTWIFHITAVSNLAAIAASGELLCKSELERRGIAHVSIAYEHIQDRRSRRVVSVPPGGVLHDYVPFHFAPRSPMLFTIHQGNVPNCPPQADIVHLVTTAQAVGRAGLPFAFSNYHAVLDFADFYNDLQGLDRIDWPLFFESPRVGGYCRYWASDSTAQRMRRKETRQAEFLVHRSVPTGVIAGVAACNDAAAARVGAVLEQAGWNVPVKSMAGWYY